MILFINIQQTLDINWLLDPPGSMFIILLIAATIALVSAGLTKWLVDTDELERKQRQIKAHEEKKEKIIDIAEVDPNRYLKLRKRWERKDEMLKKTQQSMSMQRLKPTCITFLPMIILFAVIRGLFGNGPVALTAMNANDIPLIGGIVRSSCDVEDWTYLFYGTVRAIGLEAGWINFTAWYFLCSLGINTLVQRLLGLQTQSSGGMEQMMGGSKAKALEFPDV
ncbi:MAG: EMC3/TMCO1 family protein [Promethearchaeati archaeon]